MGEERRDEVLDSCVEKRGFLVRCPRPQAPRTTLAGLDRGISLPLGTSQKSPLPHFYAEGIPYIIAEPANHVSPIYKIWSANSVDTTSQGCAGVQLAVSLGWMARIFDRIYQLTTRASPRLDSNP